MGDAVAKRSQTSIPDIIARARANFERDTGRLWDDVFLTFGCALLTDEQQREYHPTPYLMQAERELREEAERDQASIHPGAEAARRGDEGTSGGHVGAVAGRDVDGGA